MVQLSSADPSARPPRVSVPREYNAAHDLVERNLRSGRGDKIAFVDDAGQCTYAELARRVNRFASALAGLGLRREDRVMICMLDTIDWPVAFLGAIKAGVVPVAVNTLLKPQDYLYMLRDSRVRVLFLSQALAGAFEGVTANVPTLERVIVSEAPQAGAQDAFSALLASGRDDFEPAETVADEACFWLYSSGSTGAPKGTVHVHSSLIQTAGRAARHLEGRLLGEPVGLGPDLDRGQLTGPIPVPCGSGFRPMTPTGATGTPTAQHRPTRPTRPRCASSRTPTACSCRRAPASPRSRRRWASARRSRASGCS